MADSVKKTIEIIFAGVDEVSGTLKTIGGNIDSFGDNISDIGEPFKDMTEKIAMVDAAIIGLGLAGLKASGDMDTAGMKMQAALGLPVEEAERFKEIAVDVYNTGVVDDLALAFEAVTLAQQKFGDNAETDIGKVSERALELQNLFGIEYSQSITAVSTLMKNFGLDSEEAFGFIVKGYQEGLNSSGDFIESITEYSTQFAEGNASAEQFFSVMSSGFQEGIHGTDRAADAFKEFRDRITDGSKSTQEALAQIGLDNDTLTQNIDTGKMTITDAFGLVIDKLSATTDTSVRMQAGMALLGNQFHDLGTGAALAMTTAGTSVSDFQKALDSLNTETFTRRIQSAWNTLTTSVGNLEIWDQAKEKIAGVFGEIAASLPEAFDNVDFSGLIDAADEIWQQIGDIFAENDFDLTTVEGLQHAIQTVVDTITSFISVTSGIVDAFSPVVSAVTGLVSLFNQLDPSIKEIVGTIIGLGAQLTIIGGIVSAGGSLMTGLGSLLGLLTGPAGLVVGFAGLAAVVANESINAFRGAEQATKDAEKASAELNATINGLKEEYAGLPEEVRTELYAALDRGDIDGFYELLDKVPEETMTQLRIDSAEIEPVEDYVSMFNEIPETVSSEITAAINQGDFDTVHEILNGLMKDPVEVDVKVKDGAVQKVEQQFEELAFYSESGGWQTIKVPIEPELDKGKTEQTAEELAAAVDPLKTFEIQAEIDIAEIDKDIAQIKSNAETVQTALEWKAKLDIAEVEAQTKQIESTFDSINTGIQSTGDLISDALGKIGSEDFSTKFAARDVLRQEQELREQEFELQKDLVEQQTRNLELKNKMLEESGGEATIKIDSNGLEPSLEMIMWEVIQKVQLRANESAADFLLGIG